MHHDLRQQLQALCIRQQAVWRPSFLMTSVRMDTRASTNPQSRSDELPAPHKPGFRRTIIGCNASQRLLSVCFCTCLRLPRTPRCQRKGFLRTFCQCAIAGSAATRLPAASRGRRLPPAAGYRQRVPSCADRWPCRCKSWCTDGFDGAQGATGSRVGAGRGAMKRRPPLLPDPPIATFASALSVPRHQRLLSNNVGVTFGGLLARRVGGRLLPPLPLQPRRAPPAASVRQHR
mgnify:CR=1 FL=1